MDSETKLCAPELLSKGLAALHKLTHLQLQHVPCVMRQLCNALYAMNNLAFLSLQEVMLSGECCSG